MKWKGPARAGRARARRDGVRCQVVLVDREDCPPLVVCAWATGEVFADLEACPTAVELPIHLMGAPMFDDPDLVAWAFTASGLRITVQFVPDEEAYRFEIRDPAIEFWIPTEAIDFLNQWILNEQERL